MRMWMCDTVSMKRHVVKGSSTMQHIQIDNGITPSADDVKQYEVQLLYDDICDCCGAAGEQRNVQGGCDSCHTVVDLFACDSITAATVANLAYQATWCSFLGTTPILPSVATPPTDDKGIDWFVDEGFQIGVMLLP